jgi:hypothetical protein
MPREREKSMVKFVSVIFLVIIFMIFIKTEVSILRWHAVCFSQGRWNINLSFLRHRVTPNKTSWLLGLTG